MTTKNKKESLPPLRTFSTPRRLHVGTTFSKESMTHQSFKAECDINRIVGNYQQTGMMPSNILQNPQYGEAPTMDLKEALDTVNQLKEQFNNQSVFQTFDEYVDFMQNYDPNLEPEEVPNAEPEKAENPPPSPPAKPASQEASAD